MRTEDNTSQPFSLYQWENVKTGEMFIRHGGNLNGRDVKIANPCKLTCFDLDETLISVSIISNSKEINREQTLSETQGKHLSNRHVYIHGTTFDTVHKPLYREQHKALIQDIASRKGKLLIVTHSTYADACIRNLLKDLFDAPEDLVNDTHIISVRDVSKASPAKNRTYLPQGYNKAEAILTYLKQKQEHEELVDVHRDYRKIRPEHIVLIDDNEGHRHAALAKGMHVIDPTGEGYKDQVISLTKTRKLFRAESHKA